MCIVFHHATIRNNVLIIFVKLVNYSMHKSMQYCETSQNIFLIDIFVFAKVAKYVFQLLMYNPIITVWEYFHISFLLRVIGFFFYTFINIFPVFRLLNSADYYGFVGFLSLNHYVLCTLPSIISSSHNTE